MAADDERRAEIEAATDALLADSGLPRYGGHRATIERRMTIAFDAADRVRDARRDEEHEQAPGESPTPDDDVIVRWECPECGWSIPDENSAGEGQPCEAWMLDDEIGEHGLTQRVRYRRIRSPQGEDHDQAAAHETEMRAAHEMPRGEGHER